MIQFIKVYRGPIIAVVAWFLIAALTFGQGYFTSLWDTVRDKDWWVENTFSVIIFTVVINWVVSISDRHREQAHKAPYEGWHVILKGLKKDQKPQRIYWQDAQKIKISSFEKWKFIKSVVSSICWIKTPTLEEAENRWVYCYEDDKKIVIDFLNMEREDFDKEEDWEEFQAKVGSVL